MAEQLHRTLEGWTTTAVEPMDDGFLFGYDLTLGMRDGRTESRQVFVEDTPRNGHRAGVLEVPLDSVGTVVTVWLYPSDPGLPALKDVVDVASTTAMLQRLNVAGSVTDVRVVSYRPGRRAVVKADGTPTHLFLKVVEPAKAASIAERHRQFRSSGLPVPRLLGWSADGVVAMSALPGVDAQAAIGRLRDPDALLDQVDFLVTLLAAVPAFNTARPSLFDRLDWYLMRVSYLRPEDADRVATIGARIARCGADGRSYGFTPVTIHGDLHLGQLFVDPDDPAAITGMLDIDTAGAGDSADDAGAFYAHLIALGETAASVDTGYSEACWRLARAHQARWHRNRNAGFANRTRAIAATHLLGHALRPLTADAERVSARLVDHAEELVRDW